MVSAPSPLDHVAAHGHEDSEIVSRARHVEGILAKYTGARERYYHFSNEAIQRLRQFVNDVLYRIMKLDDAPRSGGQEYLNWKDEVRDGLVNLFTEVVQFSVDILPELKMVRAAWAVQDERERNRPDELSQKQKLLDDMYAEVLAPYKGRSFCRSGLPLYRNDPGPTESISYEQWLQDIGHVPFNGPEYPHIDHFAYRFREPYWADRRPVVGEIDWGGAAFLWVQRERELMDAVLDLAIKLTMAPCFVSSGQMELVPEKPRLYSDVEAEMANALANLPDFQAWTKVTSSSGLQEAVITTIPLGYPVDQAGAARIIEQSRVTKLKYYTAPPSASLKVAESMPEWPASREEDDPSDIIPDDYKEFFDPKSK